MLFMLLALLILENKSLWLKQLEHGTSITPELGSIVAGLSSAYIHSLIRS